MEQIQFPQPSDLNGSQLLQELAAAGVNVTSGGISSNGGWIIISMPENQSSLAASIVSAHVGLDSKTGKRVSETSTSSDTSTAPTSTSSDTSTATTSTSSDTSTAPTSTSSDTSTATTSTSSELKAIDKTDGDEVSAQALEQAKLARLALEETLTLLDRNLKVNNQALNNFRVIGRAHNFLSNDRTGKF